MQGPWSVVLAVVVFVASGVCEIGGGWLVWKWRKEGWNIVFFFAGCLALIAYGILPTLQDADFGRTYAAYGGFFIILSFLWAWVFDGTPPDMWDGIGSAIAVAGACVIFFVPRPGPPALDTATSPSPASSPLSLSLPPSQAPMLPPPASPPSSLSFQGNGSVGAPLVNTPALAPSVLQDGVREPAAESSLSGAAAMPLLRGSNNAPFASSAPEAGLPAPVGAP